MTLFEKKIALELLVRDAEKEKESAEIAIGAWRKSLTCYWPSTPYPEEIRVRKANENLEIVCRKLRAIEGEIRAKHAKEALE